jgi:hypothetical protein
LSAVFTGHEVRVAVQVDHEPVDPQHEIGDPAADEEPARPLGGLREHDPDHAEGDVDDVVCRIETLKIPSSFAPESWPAKLRSP